MHQLKRFQGAGSGHQPPQGSEPAITTASATRQKETVHGNLLGAVATCLGVVTYILRSPHLLFLQFAPESLTAGTSRRWTG